MFCSNCGVEASGNFCSRCGNPLTAAAADRPAPEEHSVAWTHEASYRALIGHQLVRDLISAAAQRAHREMSGEEFLNKFLFRGIPVAKPVVGAIVPLYERLGARTGKQGTEQLELPIGRAIVATLCALASNGQHLVGVSQADDGCLLTAVLPSDMWSWEGTLRVAVFADGEGARLEAETNVSGQLFDWGKSARAIRKLFQDVHSFASIQP